MKKIIYTSLYFLPALALAQTGGLLEFMTSFRGLLRLLPPVIFGLAMIYFFWGGAKFILNAADEKNRADAKNKLIWGLIALAVFISILGILETIGDLIGIDTPTISGTAPVPLQGTPFPVTPYPNPVNPNNP